MNALDPADLWLAQQHRYVVGRKLGQGASGSIYEAFDRNESRAVAIKALRPLSDAETRELALTIRALARVHHPNLVRVHELFEASGRVGYAMEPISGIDWRSYVRGRDPGIAPRAAPRPSLPMVFGQRPPEGHVSEFAACSPPQLARLRGTLPQIGAGLAALHAAGKVHRDLSPQNILVDASGHVTIVDYGLVADTSPAVAPGGPAFFAIAYMAPELGSEHAGAEPADLYSVGSLLFEALTGGLPFSGSAQEVIVRKQTVPAPRPSSLVEPVPQDLEELCMRLLDRRPEVRPTARELAATLRQPPVDSALLQIGVLPVAALGSAQLLRCARVARRLAGSGVFCPAPPAARDAPGAAARQKRGQLTTQDTL